MKYYQLTSSIENEEIGFYPQTKIKNGMSIYDENPNIDQNFIENGSIEISSKSKPTNLLDKSSISKELIIDSRLKEILMEFSLPAHRFHKIPTLHNSKNLDYFWLNFLSSERHIDTENSEFEVIRTSTHSIIGKMQFISVDFYNRISDALSFEENTRFSKLVLKDTFPNTDLICFSKIVPGEFISGKLRDRLISDKVSGIKISDVDIITMHNKVYKT